MKKIVFFLFLALAFQSCEDEGPSVTDYLTAHDWIDTEQLMIINLNGDTTLTDKIVFSFRDDFTFTRVNGNSSAFSLPNGTWSLIDEERIIRLNGSAEFNPTGIPATPEELEIVRLDSDIFRYISTIEIPNVVGVPSVFEDVKTFEPKLN